MARAAGVLLAETPWDRAETSLLIDVGTNAEIVLGNDERLLAASSPTGPAFEGAQISSGQRAAPARICDRGFASISLSVFRVIIQGSPSCRI